MDASDSSLTYSNPGRDLAYDETTHPFEALTDLRVDFSATTEFGYQMAWRSEGYGVVATFPWWDHLEADRRFADPMWQPIGTRDEPFVEADQDWFFRCWRHDGRIYWVEGFDQRSWQRRMSIAEGDFDAAWRDGLRRLREAAGP